MKLNEDKCHFILFGTNKGKVDIHLGEAQIEENDEEKLLGIDLDKKLSFKQAKHYAKSQLKALCLNPLFSQHGS